ncbi:MAG: phage major capsid protein [Syntrophobacteraceae bacterium]
MIPTSLMRAREVKGAATSNNDPSGGFFVPEQVDKQIDCIRLQNTPMRRICRVIRPETPDYKKLVTTSRPSSGWVGETEARPETDVPTLHALTPAWGACTRIPQRLRT